MSEPQDHGLKPVGSSPTRVKSKGQNISVDFVDGEPGDQYMLCFHGEDPDDVSECASFFVTDAHGMYERRNTLRIGRR